MLTWPEIVEYRKSLEWAWLYRRNILSGNDLEEKILGKIFGQISNDDKARDRLTFGLRLMFNTSGVFAEIVKESIKREIESSWRDVKKFESVTFAEIVVTAYDRENEIMQSLAKINNFSKFMHGVKLSEGYSVNDLWAEIFAYIRRVNRILRLPRS